MRTHTHTHRPSKENVLVQAVPFKHACARACTHAHSYVLMRARGATSINSCRHVPYSPSSSQHARASGGNRHEAQIAERCKCAHGHTHEGVQAHLILADGRSAWGQGPRAHCQAQVTIGLCGLQQNRWAGQPALANVCRSCGKCMGGSAASKCSMARPRGGLVAHECAH